MSVKSSVHNGITTIRLTGRFDFNVRRPFRDAVKTALALPEVREIEVDLSRVSYLDSAALGMLLLSRDDASVVRKAIVLVRPAADIRPVLEIVNFHKLFAIR